jgi:DNA-binding transcriptional ArsR family regulator
MPAEFPSPETSEIELVEVLRALADPVRLSIVHLLSDGLRHCKTQEDWNLGVQKSTLSHHLKTLREAGVTETIVEGREHFIRLRRADLDGRFPGLLAGVLAGA